MNHQSADRKKQRLLALCIAGFIALNYPLLSLFDQAELTLGIPVLFLYLFLVWAVIISLIALVMETGQEPGEER
ncbi:MAG: hypothetical protein HQL72_10980 [Magnetococcales bacterium]|nr:hypothetical protein [Magnetococcales bacterium]